MSIAVSLLCSCTYSDSQQSPDEDPILLSDLSTQVVRSTTPDGMPKYVTGQLGVIPSWSDADDEERAQLALAAIDPILAQRDLHAADLRWLRTTSTSNASAYHLRFQQYIDDLEVIGGRLVVHVSSSGQVFAVNGRARGDLFADLPPPTLDPETARATVEADPSMHDAASGEARPVYLLTSDEIGYRAFEIARVGDRDGALTKELVYVDRTNGRMIVTRSQLRDAFLYRRIYNAGGTNNVPGTAARLELDSPVGNAQVDLAYDNIGKTWNAFGAKLDRHWFRDENETGNEDVKVVANYGHIKDTASCNGQWDRDADRILLENTGTAGCNSAGAIDFISHEYMHGITDAETSLAGADGESGGVNESMSDIFGAFVEAWVDGGMLGELRRSRETWLFGEKSGRTRRDVATDCNKADIAWRHSDGHIKVWLMNGGSITGYSEPVTAPQTAWQTFGTGDFKRRWKERLAVEEQQHSGGEALALADASFGS